MSWGMVAVGAGSAIGGIASGMFGKSGADKGAKATLEAARIASQTALTLNDRARADVAPFRELGLESKDMLSGILKGNLSLDELFKSSSLYDWQSEMGTRGINRQLKARGMYGSGAGLETLAMFEKGLVAEEGARWWDRLFNTTTLGANSSAQMATNTTQTGNAVAGLQTQAGMTSGQLTARGGELFGAGVGSGISSGVNNAFGYSMYKPMMDRLSQDGNGLSSGSRDMLFDYGDRPTSPASTGTFNIS